MFYMSAFKRRITYVLMFELFAITFSSLILKGMSNGDIRNSIFVAIAMSLIAIIWNYTFNTIFEKWEKTVHLERRTILVRLTHVILFETGFILLVVPFLMWFLNIGMLKALLMEVGLLIFFFFYTFAFTWVFDLVVRRDEIKQEE